MYKENTSRDFEFDNRPRYIPKIFIDRSGNEQIDKLRDKMWHAIFARNVIKLKELVEEGQKVNEESMRVEVDYCQARIDMI
mmetsp:Transcript_25016/g.24483  ORF Transcript_25016/g.24483 Transcript_25016/m.24483 type:complete len:81 (+) Transcript_25016:210-452(+)